MYIDMNRILRIPTSRIIIVSSSTNQREIKTHESLSDSGYHYGTVSEKTEYVNILGENLYGNIYRKMNKYQIS